MGEEGVSRTNSNIPTWVIFFAGLMGAAIIFVGGLGLGVILNDPLRVKLKEVKIVIPTLEMNESSQSSIPQSSSSAY